MHTLKILIYASLGNVIFCSGNEIFLVMRFHKNRACVLLIIEGASLTSQLLAHRSLYWVYYILKQIDECQDFSHH